LPAKASFVLDYMYVQIKENWIQPQDLSCVICEQALWAVWGARNCWIVDIHIILSQWCAPATVIGKAAPYH